MTLMIRREREPKAPVDCRGKNKTVVVIRVLSDQIHASRGNGDMGRERSESLVILLTNGLRIHWIHLYPVEC